MIFQFIKSNDSVNGEGLGRWQVFSPFSKGGGGDFMCVRKIPINPPLEKGDLRPPYPRALPIIMIYPFPSLISTSTPAG